MSKHALLTKQWQMRWRGLRASAGTSSDRFAIVLNLFQVWENVKYLPSRFVWFIVKNIFYAHVQELRKILWEITERERERDKKQSRANLKRIVFHPVLNWSSWFSWNRLYFNHYVYQCCNSRGCNFLLCYESVVQIFAWGLLHPMDASTNNFTWDWQLIANFKIYIQRSFFWNFFESSLLICFLWFY